MYDLFNKLIQQFQMTLSNDNYILTKREFQNCFDICLDYLNNIPINQQNDQTIRRIKIILRMIGLLTPIKKESFDQNCISAQQFINKIILHIRANFQELLKLVDGIEWLLFKNGLALLFALELLYQQINNSQENKLTYLYEISDKKQRQDVANELLQQLYNLEQPLSMNSNWIDLFRIVDPQIIDIKHLNLAVTFESFIMCITQISTVLQIHHQLEEQIGDYFQNRVFYNCLQSKNFKFYTFSH